MQTTIDESKKQNVTINKTVMEHAIEHVRTTNQNNKTLQQINFVRMKKQVCLPIELVGANGKRPTEWYINTESKVK